jgi:hypothetical protein
MSIPIVTRDMLVKAGTDWTNKKWSSVKEQFLQLMNVNPWLAEFIATMAIHTRHPFDSTMVALGVLEILERAEKENVFRNMVVVEEKNE